ncbi:MAG TPA: TIGR02391 family protein [Terriglobales bacterium]|nr:TIGR02391 family protein [Terriglobales bacterium]
MPNSLDAFEAITRALARLPKREPAVQPAAESPLLHPFDVRNIHPDLPPKVKELFDDGYYVQATFLACTYLDNVVQKHSAIKESGYKLMMQAFDDSNPKVKLTPLVTISEIDEQKGFRFIFAGGVQAIRNPRGHDAKIVDDIDTCLDHLAFVSLLLRRLEQAGYK